MSEVAEFFAGKRVWVAGHRGLVGSALVRRLRRERCELLLAPHAELDLLRQERVEAWVHRQRPEIIFVAAGKVGGIVANRDAPADFLAENLIMNANILATAHALGVDTVVTLGSSCIYPRDAAQPIAETALLTGPLEQTNEAYAVAKIAAIKLSEAYAVQYGRRYFSVMPTNLYGPNDNFDPITSHVLPALVRKFAEAARQNDPQVTVWGTGNVLREFLHADDLADACVFLAAVDHGCALINVGSGREISIRDLAGLVARETGFRGDIVFNTAAPDGTYRKLLDSSRIVALGWHPSIRLRDGITQMHQLWQSIQASEEPASAAAG